MAYGTRYQQKIAGRVRDDEVAFFRQNKIVTPARTASLNTSVGKQEPVITKKGLEDTQVGKGTGRAAGKVVGLPPSVH
jgi:hypothetical protein